MSIKYTINHDKVLEAIVWLVRRHPGIDTFHVAKTLFYADKLHLNKYARPVLGDTYVAMNDGPVPSKTLEFLHRKDRYLDSFTLGRISEAIEFISGAEYPSIRTKRAPDLELFSDTDLECLVEAADQYAEMDFPELWERVHKEPAYIEARKQGGNNPPISFESLIDPDTPDREALIEEIRDVAASLVM